MKKTKCEKLCSFTHNSSQRVSERREFIAYLFLKLASIRHETHLVEAGAQDELQRYSDGSERLGLGLGLGLGF